METIRADLGFVPELHHTCSGAWKGMELWNCVTTPFSLAVGNMPRWVATHWEIPLIAVALYLPGIVLLKKWIDWRGRMNVRNFAFYWNTLLSLFSLAGVVTCAPAEWYGTGLSGLFTLLFVLSKLAELVDTVL